MKKARKKASRRTTKKFEPGLPLSVVTRDGKTVTRQFDGRRVVRFGEFRGKRVAWIKFYTWGGVNHSISVRFQDRTAVNFEIDPWFTLKPRYYKAGRDDLEVIKEWPEMKCER